MYAQICLLVVFGRLDVHYGQLASPFLAGQREVSTRHNLERSTQGDAQVRFPERDIIIIIMIIIIIIIIMTIIMIIIIIIDIAPFPPIMFKSAL